MRQYILTRSAYGPGWSVDANRRRLDMSRSITARSLASQTIRRFTWVVLLHRADPLLEERRRAFAGAEFIYTDIDGSPSQVAFDAYGADWRGAIGLRDETVAMTRLDDDDALAPWVMERIAMAAGRTERRTILMLPLGVRVYHGGYSLVRHDSNAMHTLVTPPDDDATVYDYGHRKLRGFAPIQRIDARPAWLWVRHDDTISGWRTADRPITDYVRSLFAIDWSLLERPFVPVAGPSRGHVFR